MDVGTFLTSLNVVKVLLDLSAGITFDEQLDNKLKVILHCLEW